MGISPNIWSPPPKKMPQCGIQDFPVLLTFSFKAYKHVLLLNKGSGHNGPWFGLSAKLNSTATWCTMATCLDFPIIPPQSFVFFFILFVVVLKWSMGIVRKSHKV